MRSIDSLLLSKNILDGSRRVMATLRPLRLAFLVDVDDPDCALRAIASCTLSWGGMLQLLVPCPRGGEPDGRWAFLFDQHDPDEIIDMVGASPTFIDDQKKREDRVVVRWNDDSGAMVVRGVSVFSPLRRLKDEEPFGPSRVCPYPTPLHGHPLALPLAFRWGHVGTEPLEKHSPLKQALESARHDDFVALDPIDPAVLSHDQVLALVTDSTVADADQDRPGWVRPFRHTLLELTLANAAPRASYRERWNLEPDERQYGHTYTHCVIVVGSPSSVPDLCLAWNLRVRRLGSDPFPIWIDPAWLADPTMIERLERARDATRGRWAPKASDPWVGLVSASLNPDELGELAARMRRCISLSDRQFRDLFPIRFRTGTERESIAHFHDGQGRVALPDLMKIGHFYQRESMGVSVVIDGWKSPKVTGPWFVSSDDATRVAHDGIAGHLWLSRDKPYDLVRVQLNTAWNIVTQLANRVGYAAAISDKGRQAIGVLNLLEHPRELHLLASSKVYALLRDMARIVPRQAVQQTLHRLLGRAPSVEELAALVQALQAGTIDGGQFDRPHYDWNQLQSALGGGREDASWIVDWLVRRRLLFRGYELSCPECGLRRWYAVDRLATVHLCDGCQMTMPLPVPVDKALIWRYRLNETVALAVDQGILPQLLAVRCMTDRGDRPDAPFLGVLPGLDLIPLETNGPPKIEVDLFAIHDGQIIIGECKANGGELTDVEIERFAALGKRLGCVSVIYATPTSFDDVPRIVERAQIASQPMHVQLWEAPDMLDPRSHEAKPQSDPTDYLQSVITWLSTGNLQDDA